MAFHQWGIIICQNPGNYLPCLVSKHLQTLVFPPAALFDLEKFHYPNKKKCSAAAYKQHHKKTLEQYLHLAATYGERQWEWRGTTRCMQMCKTDAWWRAFNPAMYRLVQTKLLRPSTSLSCSLLSHPWDVSKLELLAHWSTLRTSTDQHHFVLLVVNTHSARSLTKEH